MYMKRVLVACVLVTGVVQAEDKEPQRIAVNCYVTHSVNSAFLRTFSGRTTEETGPGDSFLLAVTTRPGERLSVSVYPYATKIKMKGETAWEKDGEEKAVPTAQIATPRYQSAALKSLGTSAFLEWPKTAKEAKTHQASLFIPYEAIGLEHGRYVFRYRVMVRTSDGKEVDDFFIKHDFAGEVRVASLAALKFTVAAHDFDLHACKLLGAKEPRVQ
jgi:hypothetical protein